MSKICKKCKIEKDDSCFGKRKRNKDGLDTQCKQCKKQLRITSGVAYPTEYVKVCKKCKCLLPSSSFYKSTRSRDKLHSICKKCTKEYAENNKDKIKKRNIVYRKNNLDRIRSARKSYIKNNPIKTRDQTRKYTYGITSETFSQMLLSQGNKCAICGVEFDYSTPKRKPHIDHNHNTGQVRELLCPLCNSGLGFFQENTNIIQKAFLYVMKHKQTATDSYGSSTNQVAY